MHMDHAQIPDSQLGFSHSIKPIVPHGMQASVKPAIPVAFRIGASSKGSQPRLFEHIPTSLAR